MNEDFNDCFEERRSKIMEIRINIWPDHYIKMKLLSKQPVLFHLMGFW